MAIPGGEIRAALGIDYRGDQAIPLQTAGTPNPGSSFSNIVRDYNRMAGFWRPAARALTAGVICPQLKA